MQHDKIGQAYINRNFLLAEGLDESLVLTEAQVLLVENKIEFLKNQFKDKIDTSHDVLAKHTTSDAVIDHIAKNFDPTPNKIHSSWVVGQYRKANIRQEDGKMVKKDLKDFDIVKPNLERKDLNQYENISDLRDAIAPQLARTKKQAKEKEAAKLSKTSDRSASLDKQYDSEGVTGYKLKSRQQSIDCYGQSGSVAKTNWCTAANSSNNMFNNYPGGKYTMHFPSGHVLQFNHHSNQMMDERDSPVNIHTDSRYSPFKTHIQNYVEQTADAEKDTTKNNTGLYSRIVGVKPHVVDAAIDETEADVKRYANDVANNKYASSIKNENKIKEIAKSASLTHEQFSRMHSAGLLHNKSDKDNYSRMQLGKHLSSNISLSPEHYETLANDPENMNTLASNKSIPASVISKIMAVGYHSELAYAPNLTEEHIRHLVSKGEDGVFRNHNIKIPHDILTAKYETMPQLISSRADIPENIIHNIVHSKNGTAMNSLISNIPLSKEHIDTVVSNAKEGKYDPGTYGSHVHTTLVTVTNQPNLTPEHVDSLITAETANHYHQNTANINSSHMHKLIDLGNPNVYQDSRAKPEHLDKIIDNTDVKGRSHVLYNIIEHPKATAAVVTKAIAKIGSDIHSYAHEKLFNQKNVGASHLHQILDSGTNDRALKMSMLKHPTVQQSHFEKLVGDPRNHGAISNSPMAPPSILTRLATSDFPHVRENVASHKNTPKDTLKMMAADETSNTNTRAIAEKRSK